MVELITVLIIIISKLQALLSTFYPAAAPASVSFKHFYVFCYLNLRIYMLQKMTWHIYHKKIPFLHLVRLSVLRLIKDCNEALFDSNIPLESIYPIYFNLLAGIKLL